MKEKIRQRALELGFDDCRFTTADVPASAGKFQNWLAEKRHGEMAWLERTAAKRIDPHRVLSGAGASFVWPPATRKVTSGKWQKTRCRQCPIHVTCHLSRVTPPLPATPVLMITTMLWEND